MKRPAIFFDRDNTLIACDAYLGDPAKVVLVDGAAAAVARTRQLGYAAIVVSNQSGVARGMFDEDAVHAVNARLDELLLGSHPGAVIDRHAFCPYHPDGTVEEYRHDSQLRKPKPGMILEAARTLALDLSRSWVVGDAPRDIEAGIAAGCRTVLFSAPGLSKSPAAEQEMTVRPEHIATTLKEAIEYIERHPTLPADTSHPADHDAPAVDHERSFPPPSQPAAGSPSPAIRMLAQPMVTGSGKPTAALPAAATSGQVSTATPPASSAKLELLAEQILHELKRQREQPDHDFSVPKLLAGIVQILALGALLYAYLNPDQRVDALLAAIALQLLTATLLLMSRR
ncbi:MAG TPA: HAD family hydrolase [Tepidisphaeraceae bacterium]|jgi:D-glycero-D-manno-heptose 1,7-bisphosphate phosphatase|nr:HAD family hydrolase [Tepidisphaeraceae bacterium]